jgi:outer membrane protein TolC
VYFFHFPSSQPARAESLQDAWCIALGTSPQVQARQSQTLAAGLNLAAARSAWLPTVRVFDSYSYLRDTFSVPSSFHSTGGAAASSLSALPSMFSFFSSGQHHFPLSINYASLPLYTGGRIRQGVAAARAEVGARRTDEFRTEIDLKLTVAEAYLGVLRAQKNLEVAHGSVEQLSAFARDVRNRCEQQVAIRSEVLAAEVALASARLAEIQAGSMLKTAWATYNRFLCRPLDQTARLDELAAISTPASIGPGPANESEVNNLTDQALRLRPELAGLSYQASALGAQAEAARAAVKPQAGFALAYVPLSTQSPFSQGIGASAFYLDWTLSDGGVSRRKAAALRHQEAATLKQRAEIGSDIALEVRTRWLELQQARQRIPVARLAIAQAEENVKVIKDRYRQQLSTYTEVLDAENRRVQALNNFTNAVYDESLVGFRLHRAVGDL